MLPRGIGMLVFVADDQQLRTLIFWTMGGFGGVTWAAIIPALLILAIAVPTLLPAAYLLDALGWASAKRAMSASTSKD